jgi:hypothetical protein
MSIHDEFKHYIDLPDSEQEQAAIAALKKLAPMDQVKLMLWLTRRDPSLCNEEIFIAFAADDGVAALGGELP